MNIESMQREQQQELYESIRHFSKYKAFSSLNSGLAIPGEADKIQDDLIALFEEHYKDE